MSVLDSETPYREMQDKPAVSFATADSKLMSGRSPHLDQRRLLSIKEDVVKENHRFSEMIQQQDQGTEQSQLGGRGSEAESIREEARQILETYNVRLKKVGYSQFQIRLNIFFTFVVHTSVEADAYDQLQSAEGSVMDNDEIEERDYSRTNSMISQFDKSNFNSHLSDI